MEKERTFGRALERLRGARLRPTRQRLGLAKLLFENGHRHVTAEILHQEAKGAGLRVSLATIYNTLHQFTTSGLLREIVMDPMRFYFDTNTSNHHHFYFEDSGLLEDIMGTQVVISEMPTPPKGAAIDRVDVIVRLKNNA
ncbi:MAG: transcriptional repressor [Rhodospirillales bacterium]|nr:transcriptional repressor [Rhodospirillales bacterium]